MGAEALMFADPKLTPVTCGCVAGVVCPAAILTLAGDTVTLVVSLLLSVTVRAELRFVLRVTVPVIVPPASTAADGNVTVSAGPSASVNVRESDTAPAVKT